MRLPRSLAATQAFSLVELSIVLVILGLLVGGVLSGQSLIRAAELRSVSTDYQRYITATQTFRDKYIAIPGDMSNASTFWDIAHTTDATCVTTESNDKKTCNGNGDGLVQWVQAGGESYRYWQHLANAGLIEGQYTGAPHSGKEIAGMNIPLSKISNAGWIVANVSGMTTKPYLLQGNVMEFAKSTSAGAFELGVLKSEEAWNLDKKMDDGLADGGKLVAGDGNGQTGCITGTNFSVGATYDLAASGTVCRLLYEF